MLKIEAVTKRNTQAALFSASESITDSGGWITNHKLYSNVQAMVAFEVPQAKIQNLLDALAKAEIVVSSCDKGKPVASEDIAGQLVLTFANGEPDLRRDVPAFG